MKGFCFFYTFFLICGISFGQSAGKIGGVNDNVITKIGSVPINSISKTGSVTTQVIYKNCKEILLNYPGSPDGVYTIDPDGSGTIAPFNCFCDMTTDGGGWTMLGYYKYPANYQDFMFAGSDASYGTEIANPNSSSAWTDWRVLAGVTWPAWFAIILDQPTYSTWGAVNAKVIQRVKSRNVMPNYGTVQDLATDDNLYYKFSFITGWTDVGASSASGTYYWYPYSSGGRQLIGFHIDNSYTSYYGSAVPGGNDTWYHSARLFIR
jgi:hypothetical protein